MEKFRQVFYISVSGNDEIGGPFEEGETLVIENSEIKTKFSMNSTFASAYSLSEDSQNNIFNCYNRYRKIDSMINSQIKKSMFSRSMFSQNELCISYYGLYFNFISLKHLENLTDTTLIQSYFLEQFISEKGVKL